MEGVLVCAGDGHRFHPLLGSGHHHVHIWKRGEGPKALSQRRGPRRRPAPAPRRAGAQGPAPTARPGQPPYRRRAPGPAACAGSPRRGGRRWCSGRSVLGPKRETRPPAGYSRPGRAGQAARRPAAWGQPPAATPARPRPPPAVTRPLHPGGDSRPRSPACGCTRRPAPPGRCWGWTARSCTPTPSLPPAAPRVRRRAACREGRPPAPPPLPAPRRAALRHLAGRAGPGTLRGGRLAPPCPGAAPHGRRVADAEKRKRAAWGRYRPPASCASGHGRADTPTPPPPPPGRSGSAGPGPAGGFGGSQQSFAGGPVSRAGPRAPPPASARGRADRQPCSPPAPQGPAGRLRGAQSPLESHPRAKGLRWRRGGRTLTPWFWQVFFLLSCHKVHIVAPESGLRAAVLRTPPQPGGPGRQLPGELRQGKDWKEMGKF